MFNEEFNNFFESIKDKLGIRKASFTKIFQYLDNIKGPINIVETGCLRIKDNFKGDGQSTLLFDKYTQYREDKSKVYTVDINPKATEICKSVVSDNVEIHTGDSVRYLTVQMPKLKKEEKKISLIYLDSFDVDWQSSDRAAAHHLKELIAVINHISEETLIVIDDAPIFAPMKIEDKKLSVITEHPAPKPFVGGKGYLVNEFAYACDATLYFSNYQTAWFNFKKKF
tara:strand:+ start:1091 stop:1768 length:678 start_codon:yes stop_codon:yes gene_type:complete